MNEFLDYVWLDNPVRHYLSVLGFIVFVVILKRIISVYIAGLLFKLINRIWKGVDKKSFIFLLIQPLGFFLLILLSTVSLHKLRFPTELNVELYGYSLKTIFFAVARVVLIGSFIWLLLRIIDFIAIILEKKANQTVDQSDNQLIVFFRDFFKVILAIIGLMMILSYVFSVNVGSMITGLSIIGAGIALALRESLENLIASFIIFFDKPFTTGDLVKVNNIVGVVEKIGLRSTRIRSDQKTLVSMPNKQMVDSIMDNLSLRTQRRTDIKLELELSTKPEALEQIIISLKEIVKDEAIIDATVVFGDITPTAFLISIEYYTSAITMQEYNALKQKINLEIIQKLAQIKIEFANVQKEIRIMPEVK